MATSNYVPEVQEEKSLMEIESAILSDKGDKAEYTNIQKYLFREDLVKNYKIDTLYKILKLDSQDFEKIARDGAQVNARNPERKTLLSLLIKELSDLRGELRKKDTHSQK